MSMPQIVRPKDISPDKREEFRRYLQEMWRRAHDGRTQQVDEDYTSWSRIYEGTPLEKVRTVPFYKASNLVVKLTRIYADTFLARTLNIIFATKPLYVVDGLPRELRDAFQMYLDKKALYEWEHYKLARNLIHRGNKNGTVVVKFPWVEKQAWDVMASSSGVGMDKEKYIYYSGPDTQCIPFEDFYIYPITSNSLEDAEILFHRVRYPEEQARRMAAGGENAIWTLPEDKEIDQYLLTPRDAKRLDQQSEAGVTDTYYRELALIECHCKYDIGNNGVYYDVIGLLEPTSGDLFDIFFNPYPRNQRIFQDYRPFPREDFFYGESLCALLAMAQEETSKIHNERRDNSCIANSVVFKRRSGSLLPNPSTNWYPGKVFDLQDMQDLDVVQIGRNYTDTIQQEDYTFQQASQLTGISEVMQGASQGQMGKGGQYNTMGTIATMQEGNQRQDTNIRDVRCVLGAIAQGSTWLQAHYGADDPLIDTLPDGAPQAVRAALQFFASPKSRYTRFEVKTSNSGVNKEVEKANLFSLAQVLGQYGQTVQQMVPQLLDPSMNQGLRMIMNDIVNMHAWMAKRLLKEFDEWDGIEVLPDVHAALEAVLPGGSIGTETGSKQGGTGQPGQSAVPGAPPPLSRPGLESMANLPSMLRGQASNGGMAPGNIPGQV